jgi:hypothetical protein
VARDTLVSASYIGTQTVHIWTTRQFNVPIFFPGNAVNGVCTAAGYVFRTTGTCSTATNINDRRMLTLERPQDGQYIGALDDFEPGGTQSYHGLLVTVQRRATRGLTLNSNYTLSHCIGDHWGTAPAASEAYQDPNNRDLDRGNCEADRRHILNFTALVETPEFSGKTLRTLASGWRLSGIYRTSSGAPLTIASGDDRALSGNDAQRANQVLADPYGDKSGRAFTNYFNRDAFAQPAVGTLGNMGPRNIQGPRTWQFDMSLSRIFRLRETHRLEVRAEAYNVTNSFRPLVGGSGGGGGTNAFTTLTNSRFGQIREAYEPRIMQFALKYVF